MQLGKFQPLHRVLRRHSRGHGKTSLIRLFFPLSLGVRTNCIRQDDHYRINQVGIHRHRWKSNNEAVIKPIFLEILLTQPEYNAAMTEIYRTALSGLAAAGARIASDANNIANIYSTGRLPTKPGEQTDAYAPTRVGTRSAPNGGVIIDQTAVNPAYNIASDPSSPKANADGLVATPNVDLATELVDLQVTSVLYTANAAVIKAENENEKRLLDTIA